MSEVKAGDRVKVTVVGTVAAVGQYTIVLPDGTTSANHFATDAKGVTVEVIEPEWQARDVVLDAGGVVWQRALNGGWWLVGFDGRRRDEEPRRPLTLLVRGGKKV